MEQHDEMMRNFPPSLAAAKKIGTLPEGFAFYEFGWLGDRPEDFTVMQVRGAVFREATRGPNKGRRTVKVAGTERTIFVTEQEIRAESPNSINRHKSLDNFAVFLMIFFDRLFLCRLSRVVSQSATFCIDFKMLRMLFGDFGKMR